MSTYSDKIERHYILKDFENKLKRKSSCRSLKFLKNDDDKRTRREVANNNERRRMQSINAGFENLRKLLPYCNEKEKISKANILQSTAKYIADLQMKINSLESDVLRLTNLEKILINDKSLSIDSLQFNEESRSDKIKEKIQYSTLDSCLLASSCSTSDFGSSLSSSITCNFSTLDHANLEDDVINTTNESIEFSQQQNNLEQLLAAVEQVERLEAMQAISLKNDLNGHKAEKSSDSVIVSTSNYSTLDTTNFVVMKPTISPITEKIIQDAVNMHQPYHQLSTSIINSNSFILPLNCPANLTTSVTKNSSKITIPSNNLHRSNLT